MGNRGARELRRPGLRRRPCASCGTWGGVRDVADPDFFTSKGRGKALRSYCSTALAGVSSTWSVLDKQQQQLCRLRIATQNPAPPILLTFTSGGTQHPKTEASLSSPCLLPRPGHHHLPARAAFSLVPCPPAPPTYSSHSWNSLGQSQVGPWPAKLPCVLMPFITTPQFTCPSLPPSVPSLSALRSHFPYEGLPVAPGGIGCFLLREPPALATDCLARAP